MLRLVKFPSLLVQVKKKYRGKFGTPKTAWGLSISSEFPRISRKISPQRAPNMLHRGYFVFSATDSLAFAKYLGVSAKLEAWRNHPYPTPNYGRETYTMETFVERIEFYRYARIAGNSGRPKPHGLSEFPRISRISWISRKIGTRRAPNIPNREVLVFRLLARWRL